MAVAARRNTAPRPTYSPSAMHSISSTCPLSTVIELEGPDGMKNDGLLSFAGSSADAHTRFRGRHSYHTSPLRSSAVTAAKPLRSGTRPLHYRPQSPCFMIRCKFYVVVYRSGFCGRQLNSPLGGYDIKKNETELMRKRELLK